MGSFFSKSSLETEIDKARLAADMPDKEWSEVIMFAAGNVESEVEVTETVSFVVDVSICVPFSNLV